MKKNMIKISRKKAGMSRKDVANQLGIPKRILKHYEKHFDDIPVCDYLLLKEYLDI